MLGTRITSFFLSKVNVTVFSDLIKKNSLLSAPYKLVAQRLIDRKFPHHIFLETTNICNLKCEMCPRDQMRGENGFMDSGIFKKAVNETKKYGPKNFSLHLFGEPLMDPGFIEKIDYIKKQNPKNSILLTTNATLLKNRMAEEIIKIGVDKIAISLHTTDPEVYKKITGVDALRAVEKNILDFIQLKNKLKSQKPKIILRMIVGASNTDDAKNFKEKWSKLPVVVEIRPAHNYGGHIENNPRRKITRKRYPCYHLWLSPGINWDGEVSICCNDPLREATLGNIKNRSISEIWRSSQMEKYRKHHLRGEYDKIKICKNCDVWDIYPDIFFDWQKK